MHRFKCFPSIAFQNKEIFYNKVVVFEFPFHENKTPQGQGILSAVFTAVHPVPQWWQQETAI